MVHKMAAWLPVGIMVSFACTVTFGPMVEITIKLKMHNKQQTYNWTLTNWPFLETTNEYAHNDDVLHVHIQDQICVHIEEMF